VSGKTYGDLVNMKITPFVLPYHIHGFQMTQIIPYMQDLCVADSSKCYMDQYAELSFKNLGWITQATDKSETQFEAEWAKTVAKEYSLPEQDILDLWSSKDTHDSNWRVREFWKYGASVGVSGAPVGFVNGVKLDEWPASKSEWISLIGTLIP